MYSAAGYSSDEDYYDDFLFDDYDNLENIPQPAERNLERELYRACISNRVEEVREILDTGFNVNAILDDGWTALLVAASVGAKECIVELVSRGADVNLHKDGHTALMAICTCLTQYASHEVVYECVKLLLEKGADPTSINRTRMNALMYAAGNGNCLAVEELLKVSNKDAEDNQGWTALFWAVSSKEPSVVKLLLDAGLKCDILDIRGDSPYQYAVNNDYKEIVKLLPSIGLKSYEQVYTLNHDNFMNFFENGSTAFTDDICVILYGMRSENAINKFIEAKTNFFDFLCCDEYSLMKIGIKMPYERCRILKGLHRFHSRQFKLKSVPIIKKNDTICTSDVASAMLSASRHFIVMQASLRYIYENARIEDFKDFKNEISETNLFLRTLNNSLLTISTKVQEWDKLSAPVDLITKQSCRKIKKNSKWFYRVGVLSLIFIVVKVKFY